MGNRQKQKFRQKKSTANPKKGILAAENNLML
jgi:hypothetical protein